MRRLPLQGRTLALLAFIVPLLALFVFVGLRSGPLAPVAVTVATVQSRALAPALFGIGTVEARYTYRIGPTVAGRVERLDVHVGDRVRAGQVLGAMDPVDLDARVRALEARQAGRRDAARGRGPAGVCASAGAPLRKAAAGALDRARRPSPRSARSCRSPDAVLRGRRGSRSAPRAEREALRAARNLRLVAPVDGVVVLRDAEPGTTVVAGQAVVELIDPASLWINVRFDQLSAAGLATALPARIVLRSRAARRSPVACSASSPRPTRSPRKRWPRWCSRTYPAPCRPWANWPRSRWAFPGYPPHP
jgi:HlyD family secretion protein